jgi:hypothetical protein
MIWRELEKPVAFVLGGGGSLGEGGNGGTIQVAVGTAGAVLGSSAIRWSLATRW